MKSAGTGGMGVISVPVQVSTVDHSLRRTKLSVSIAR